MDPIKTYGFKPGLPAEFEILDTSDLYPQYTHIIASPHRASFYHVLWFESAGASLWVDFNRIDVPPDTLLFLGRDTVLQFPEERTEARAILFTEDFFAQTERDHRFLRSAALFRDLTGPAQIDLSRTDLPVQEVFGAMSCELRNPADAFQPGILHNHLSNLLLLGERICRQGVPAELRHSADLDYVLLFKDRLEEDFRQQRQVSHFAAALALTEKRLAQATARVLGKTPKELIDDRVMLEARRMLVHTAQRVKEIGFGLGFDEPTNFIKYFRKHSGQTPAGFRAGFPA